MGPFQNVASNSTILVLKAYETYVGDNKFQPDGQVFNHIADVGKEYGTRTGRRRQVNYLDLTRLENTIHMSMPRDGFVDYI